MNTKILVAVGSFLIGFPIFYLLAGNFVILFVIIWMDKVFLSNIRIHGEFGIEFVVLPTIITGIMYGPLAGFLFGFFILPIFDIIQYVIAPPMEEEFRPPGIPNIGTFVIGLTGALAGLISFLPFITIILIAVVFKAALNVTIERFMDIPMRLSHPLNIIFNVAFAFLLKDLFLFIILA